MPVRGPPRLRYQPTQPPQRLWPRLSSAGPTCPWGPAQRSISQCFETGKPLRTQCSGRMAPGARELIVYVRDSLPWRNETCRVQSGRMWCSTCCPVQLAMRHRAQIPPAPTCTCSVHTTVLPGTSILTATCSLNGFCVHHHTNNNQRLAVPPHMSEQVCCCTCSAQALAV
jgi:hypothetical protein